MPTFVVDASGDKIPVMPRRIVTEDADGLMLQNYIGDRYYRHDVGAKGSA